MKIRQLSTAAIASALLVGLVGGLPAVAAADTATVTGRVTLGGEPLRGVDVILEPDGTLQSPRSADGVEVAQTNHDGVFRFTKVPVKSRASTGAWLVRVDGRKYGALETYHGATVRHGDATRLTLSAGDTTTADVEMVAGATIKGRIVDEKGRPVAKVYVVVAEGGYWWTPVERTDAAGNFRFHGLGGGDVTISWGHDGSAGFTTTRGTTTTVPDLVLKPPVKKPLGTVKVKATGLKKDDDIILFNTKTREVETFAWAGARAASSVQLKEKVAPGTYRLVVGGTNTASKKFSVRAGKTTKVPTLKAPKKRTTLTGKVTRRDGKPLSSGRVFVIDKFGTSLPRSAKVKDGTYKISGLTKGNYTIRVEHPKVAGHQTTQHFKVTKSPKAKKKVTLTKTATVTGTITNTGGQPVRGIQLAFAVLDETTCTKGTPWEKYTSAIDCRLDTVTGPVTDEDGRFTFENVPQGAQVLLAYDPGIGDYAPTAKQITVKKSGTVWNVEVSAR